MNYPYKNLVFSGGGILGIAYIGMLDYLFRINFMPEVQRVAGSSAGAIAACITAFNLPFEETKNIVNSLDYSKVPSISDPHEPKNFSKYEETQLDKVFGNIECVYRLVKKFGWYSSSYFYQWIRHHIANQFDATKKIPPYTFADFMNPDIHKDGRSFKELYIIGTDISNKSSTVFSAADTPYMEVAEAVRISMSVPVFFEAVKSIQTTDKNLKVSPRVFSDGGIMYNYPITIFDRDCPSDETLGALFKSNVPPAQVNHLVDFIVNLISCTASIQTQLTYNTPVNMKRSIQIYTGSVSSLDFNVKTGDEIYTFLYGQGYKAAETYFSALFSS